MVEKPACALGVHGSHLSYCAAIRSVNKAITYFLTVVHMLVILSC